MFDELAICTGARPRWMASDMPCDPAMTQTHAPNLVGERRRSRRVRTREKLQAQLVPLELAVTVLDISRDGFAVVSQIDFRRGQKYEFEFSSARNASVRLIGTNVHSMRVLSAGEPWYAAGFSLP